jgi:predicted Zn-dependent peptidase
MFNRLMYPSHPYGQQTTIGKAEHLKNPSMKNIHNYWNKYYVANNMAIILSGDLNYDETIQKIDKYFGSLRKDDNLSHPTFAKEEPITQVRVGEVFGPEEEFVQLGFRLGGIKDKDNLIAELISMILYNGRAGLIDIDLVKQQKVLHAHAYIQINKDYGELVLRANALKGQKLEDVKDLLLAELEKIKNGEFQDWLPEAIINNKRLSQLQKIEYNYYIYDILNTFILGVPWKYEVEKLDKMEKITKQEIMDYAKKTFNNNYVVVYKRNGVNEHIVKVEKPKITPLKFDRSKESEFLKKFNLMPETRMKPEFADFKELIKTDKIENVAFNYIRNKNNELSTLFFILDMGDFNIKELSVALNYFEFIGTKDKSADELAKEYFKIGVFADVGTGNEQTYIFVSGLQKNFSKALNLFINNINNAEADKESFDKYIASLKKKRANRKLSKRYIASNEISYAQYGENNPQRYALTNDELDQLDPVKMVQLINHILEYEHCILYYGPEEFEDAKILVMNAYSPVKNLKKIPEPVSFKELENEGKVYFTNYDMVQSSITLISKGQKFNPELMAYNSMFNEFFGTGMASIVFQELRESKGLVYSAYAYVSTPNDKNKSYYLMASLNTQPDKISNALDAILDILNNLPDAKIQFEEARKAALIRIESMRLTKSEPFWIYKRTQKLGLDYNIYEAIYNKIQTMSYEDFQEYFNNNIAKKNFDIVVMGNEKDIDFNLLQDYGEIIRLNLDDLFPY